MPHVSDFQIHINGQQTFFVSEEILSTYSARLTKIIRQERRGTQIKNSGIRIDDFPGGPDGFELVSRFCYNNGRITLTVSNVCLLHCSAIFLGMTEKLSPRNLLQKTNTFLDGLFEWSLKDVLACLKSCHSFFDYADSSGLLDKLITALLTKIAQNSDVSNLIASSPSSSLETASGFRLSSSTPKSIRPSSSSRAWWFDDVAVLPPNIIAKLLQILGAYGPKNNNLILTRFLLHSGVLFENSDSQQEQEQEAEAQISGDCSDFGYGQPTDARGTGCFIRDALSSGPFTATGSYSQIGRRGSAAAHPLCFGRFTYQQLL